MTGLATRHHGKHQRTRWAGMIAAIRREVARWHRYQQIG